MAQIITEHWIVYKDVFLPAGTHQIDDGDVEAMRPYGTIIETKPVEAKKSAKKTVKKVEDDPLA